MSRNFASDIDDEDYQDSRETIQEVAKRNLRERTLVAHGSCNDPEHLGCQYCREEEE